VQQVQLDKTATETYNMLELAFGEETMQRTQIFEWFLKFKTRISSVEDAKYLGLLPTVMKLCI
jgi:hypothetical protein